MNEYLEENEEIQEEALIRGLTPLQVFFERYSAVSTERGDGPDFDPCFLRGVTKSGGALRLDGWALETFEAEKGKKGVNIYAIGCFFDSESEDVSTIGAQEIDKYFNEIRRGVDYIFKDEFLSNSEITDENTLEFAFQFKEALEQVSSIKLLVFSNKIFETQRKSLTVKDIHGIPTKCAVLDWKEYKVFSSTGTDPIIIDFYEAVGHPVPCIETSSNPEVSSYLLAMEGNTIADLFQRYDNRLLESNVRTYLQARTQTNKGILKTVSDEPHLFFAYNNGITATASAAEFANLNGSLHLVELTNLQIVNGGQTTASLLYAREHNKVSLDGIRVQVKLNIISEEASKGSLVPNISRYSNTQNKVTEADLISTEAFQSDIERVIKNLTPPKKDRIIVPKWFYERARGQYKSLFMYKRPGERQKLQALYPPSQNLNKTDLAKFYMSVERKPHVVSKGAQKCFLEFSKRVSAEHAKNASYINEAWGQDVVGRAILFRELDSGIVRSDWYKADRGFKSQIVTYTVAALAHFFYSRGMVIDTKSIWLDQSVAPRLLKILVELGFAIGRIIKEPPIERSVRNPSEFAKTEYCWNQYVSPIAEELDEYVERYGILKSEWSDWLKSSQEAESTASDIKLWEELRGRSKEVKEVVEFLKRTDAYTKAIDGAFGRMFRGKHKEGDGVIIAKSFSKYDSA